MRTGEVPFEEVRDGYKLSIRQNFSLCGYIGVPKGNKFYGIPYDNYELAPDLGVHGGLTYSKQEGDYWVFGWDYNHFMDAMTAEDAPKWGPMRSGHAWTLNEVKQEVMKAFEEMKTLSVEG